MKKFLLLLLLIIHFSLYSQNMNDINIVPKPAEMKVLSAEKFIINKDTKITLGHGNGIEKYCNYLNDYFKKNYGFRLPVIDHDYSTPESNYIVIGFTPLPPDPGDTKVEGSYSLRISQNNI